MELAESIKTAWTAVEESGVPEHMQELAFKEAFRSLLGTAQLAQQPKQKPRGGSGGSGGAKKTLTDGDGSSTMVDEDAVITAVSEHTGVPTGKLEKVFHLDNDTVKILVKSHGTRR